MKSLTAIQGTMTASVSIQIETWPLARFIPYARNPRKQGTLVNHRSRASSATISSMQDLVSLVQQCEDDTCRLLGSGTQDRRLPWPSSSNVCYGVSTAAM